MRPPDEFVVRLGLLVEHSGGPPKAADAIGVHRSRVNRWLDGVDSPSGEKLAAVADAYKVTMDWLWGRDEAGGPPWATPEMVAARRGAVAAGALGRSGSRR